MNSCHGAFFCRLTSRLRAIGLFFGLISVTLWLLPRANALDETDLKVLAEQLGRKVLTDEESRQMLPRFVTRNLVPPPLATREQWLNQRRLLRQKTIESLGINDLVPAAWPLNVLRSGTIERDGYWIEKITLESYPGMAVPALVYVPKKITRRAPGVVSIAGHVYGMGKAADFLQQRNVNLALRGCVVLAYDYIDCGERNTGEDPRNGKPYGGGNDHGIRSFSHSIRNPTGLEVLDGIRAIDYLISRDDVDPERIGFTGESGGGNSTYWVAAVDSRVYLAVPVSSVTSFDYWIQYDRNWDWHQRPWGVRRHLDIGGLLALHAPAPLIAISSQRGTDDEEFPWDHAERSVAWARQVYNHLGASDSIAHHESTTGHGYQQDKREILYVAVEKYLRPEFPRGKAELAVPQESFENLRCGLPKENRTFRDVFQEWTRDLPREFKPGQTGREQLSRSFLRGRLGWPEKDPAIDTKAARDRITVTNTEMVQGRTIASLRIETEEGIVIPAVHIKPNNATNEIVLVPGRGLSLAVSHLQQRKQVIALDLRGAGEIRNESGVLKNWAWFVGRPIMGMQAWDLATVARLVRLREPGSKISVSAPSDFAWVTLLTVAAVPELFESAQAPLLASSLHESIEARGDAALADIPGLLEHLDVPQLMQLAKPFRRAE